MKFRTPLAAAAAVAMLVGLAACGGGDDDNASGASTTTQTDTSTGTSTGTDSGHSGMAMITMMDNSFSPADVTVAPGTEVMIMNKGAARHDVKDKGSNGKAFASGDIDGGKEGTITAPAKAGDYPYKCTYHFGMEGTLHVK